MGNIRSRIEPVGLRDALLDALYGAYLAGKPVEQRISVSTTGSIRLRILPIY